MKNSIFLQLLISTITQFPVCADAQNNVGIGTTTPLTKLTVQTPTGHFGITHTDGTITVGTYIGNGKAWFGTTTNQPLAFYTNNSNEQVTLLTNGNLGIGTAAPSTKLTVRTPNNTDGFEHISDGGIVMRSRVGGTSATIGTVTNHTFRLTANNVPHLNLEPNGNIGVGLTDPVYRMDFVDRIRIRSNGGNTAGLWLNNPANTATIAFLGVKAVDLVGFYGNVSGWGLAMNTNTGDLAIGTQNPVGGYKLSVFGNSYVSGSLKVRHSVFGLAVEREATGDNWEFLVSEAPGDLWLIRNNFLLGVFDDATGAYTAMSDERLKTHIRAMSPMLEKISQLKPSTYQFKNTEDGREYNGFIAQDVMELFPSLVIRNVVPERNLDVYTMDYSGFGVIAIKAIQEQQAIIESLQAQMDAMQATLSALEKNMSKKLRK